MSPSQTRPGTIVFALWLLVFSASSQIMIIAPILPQIGAELGVSDAVLGTLVSAYALMVGVFAIIAGPISDKIGRRKILLLGTGTMTVALIMHSFVQGYFSFLGVRIFAGMAGGVLSGAAVAYVGDYFPYNRRGWATGWIMSGAAFGQIIGIPLGVVIADRLGILAPFSVFALTMGLTWFLVWFKVPQPDVQRSEGRLTIRGALQDYLAMLARPEIAWSSVAFFLMFLGVSLYVVYFPTWLERSFADATPNGIAALFFVGGIANVFTGPQAGRLSDRVGRKAIILTACVGLSIVMALTPVVTTSFRMAYPVFFLTMVLVAMRISPFSALLTALVTDHRRGALMSLTVALGQVGFAFGGAIAGPLFAGRGYGSNAALAALSVLGMGLIVWFFVPEPPLEDGSPAVAGRGAAGAGGGEG